MRSAAVERGYMSVGLTHQPKSFEWEPCVLCIPVNSMSLLVYCGFCGVFAVSHATVIACAKGLM
jgi:hypothetical protein